MVSYHDAFARKIFGRPLEARALLEAALPAALLGEIDLSTLELVPGSYVEPALSDRRSDLLYSARMGDGVVLCHVLCEHKSSDDPGGPLQIHVYQGRIWTDYTAEHGPYPLPLIVPIVLYQGEEPLRRGRSMAHLFDLPRRSRRAARRWTRYPAPIVYDLRRLDEAEVVGKVGRGSSLATMALLLMRSIRDPDLAARLEGWGPLLAEAVSGPGGEETLEALITYVMLASRHAIPVERVTAVVSKYLGPESAERVMIHSENLVEKRFQQGVEQGVEQGLQQGLKQGREQGLELSQRASLLRLLELRFGAVPADVRARVEQSELALVTRWFERAATARSLSAVFSA